MAPRVILLEKSGRGRGVVLGADGQFCLVRVPPRAEIGDELPIQRPAGLPRPAFAAAAVAACLLLFGSFVFFTRGESRGTYSLVILRLFQAKSLTVPEPGSLWGDTSQNVHDLHMTLAVDRRGVVASVQPKAPQTANLVGMRVEQAIQHTVGQIQEFADGDVEVRPGRARSRDETAKLETLIRKALPQREPPIEVQIGPPADDDAIDSGQEEDAGGNPGDGLHPKKGKR